MQTGAGPFSGWLGIAVAGRRGGPKGQVGGREGGSKEKESCEANPWFCLLKLEIDLWDSPVSQNIACLAGGVAKGAGKSRARFLQRAGGEESGQPPNHTPPPKRMYESWVRYFLLSGSRFRAEGGSLHWLGPWHRHHLCPLVPPSVRYCMLWIRTVRTSLLESMSGWLACQH